MNTDALLKEAWLRATEAYRRGRINSERTLQANLFASLQELAPDAIIFCEPQLRIDGLGTVIPDIVLVREREIETVFELKFAPHHLPVFEGDLAKLQRYSEWHDSFHLCLDPDSGKYSDHLYRFAKSCQFIFAAIGRPDSAATDEAYLRKKANLGERFTPLVYKAKGMTPAS